MTIAPDRVIEPPFATGERNVRTGLRKTLLAQAKRLAWLAERRMRACGVDGGEE